jgi:hypothetical protein
MEIPRLGCAGPAPCERYISDPKGKAKSVVLSAEGLELARVLFERHFALTVK